MNKINKQQLIQQEEIAKTGDTEGVLNLIGELDEFSLVRGHTKFMEMALLSEEMANCDHGEIEKFVFTQGNELLRLYVQSAIDIRSKREERLPEVVGKDEVARTHVRKDCQRSLTTLFGEVRVNRIGYSNRVTGSESLFPLDMKLNLPDDKYSHGLRERTAIEARKQSFDEAVASIASTTGGKVPKRQAQEVVVKFVQDFEDFYKDAGARQVTTSDSTSDLLVISLDGKGIVMRPESLRDQTKRANANEKHKLKTRLSKGEKRNRKRMAMVATIYDIERQTRTAEEIMNANTPNDENVFALKRAVRPKNKRVWASVERSSDAVVNEVFEEALRRDPLQMRTWVILVDGQPQQLRYIRACMKKLGVKADVILDLIHVLEYLWKSAYCFEQEGSEEAEAWVKQRALKVLHGEASNVASGIRGSATKRRLSEEARAAADTAAEYLLKHKDMLRYDDFLEGGYPIATGVIEGACRHLIKDRLDITGARWSTEGAEAILKLRSLHSSGDLTAYLSFHKSQELQRNHISQYHPSFLQHAA